MSGQESPWRLYDDLIDGIPEGIVVIDYCLGTCWSYVEAESGMGIAWTANGGAKRTDLRDLRCLELRKVASLAKSWCFEEATLGIAALNAWYSQPRRFEEIGALRTGVTEGAMCKDDAFDLFADDLPGKNVVVVGRFPNVKRIADKGAKLVVLERNVRDASDTPDPACEYVLPDADYAFITGVTLTNKTAPRLLALSQHANTIMVGPSVVLGKALFDHGADVLAGSAVMDPDRVRYVVSSGIGRAFGDSIAMVTLEKE